MVFVKEFSIWHLTRKFYAEYILVDKRKELWKLSLLSGLTECFMETLKRKRYLYSVERGLFSLDPSENEKQTLEATYILIKTCSWVHIWISISELDFWLIDRLFYSLQES